MSKTLQPFLKALAPAVLGAVASVVNALVAGTFNTASLATVLGGLVTAAIVYFVPNSAPPAATPKAP